MDKLIVMSIFVMIQLIIVTVFIYKVHDDTPTMPRASSFSQQKYYEGFDMMNQAPFEFLPEYKNPCWYEVSKNNELFCLPYFYLIGTKKSGTSDLYNRLTKHPEFVYPGFKESQWLSGKRFKLPVIRSNGLDVRTPLYFASMFSPASRRIGIQTNCTPSKPCRRITGDASPSNLYKNTRWSKLPGNEHRIEPRYTNLDYLHHMTPNAKIIIIFRDPISRLQSDYYYGLPANKRSPQQFHNLVVKYVSVYRRCIKKQGLRPCVYNERHKALPPYFEFSLNFYAFFMRELLALFPRENILPLLMEDYIKHKNITFRKVYDFLSLDQPSDEWMQHILSLRIGNKGRTYPPMFNETKELLKEFIAPYNEDMATLMNNSRYLF